MHSLATPIDPLHYFVMSTVIDSGDPRDDTERVITELLLPPRVRLNGFIGH